MTDISQDPEPVDILGGALQPEALIERSRQAVLRANGALHAFTVISEKSFISKPSLPLNGLAVGVKDLYDTADMVTTYGSAIYQNHVPMKDAVLVQRLRELGAFMLGKTVTTEFAWRRAGPTVNPYLAGHTPGGSSSGSAAAVAAGLVPLALGTQTFGSIVRPAAFCGVFGFKPTFGVLPIEGIHPLSPTLDHAGYLARSVRLVRHVHSLLTGQALCSHRSTRKPRFKLVRGPYWGHASPAQRRELKLAGRKLRAAGAEVKEQELPPRFNGGLAIAEAILHSEAAAIYQPLVERHPNGLSPHMLELVSKGADLTAADFTHALASRDSLKSCVEQELDPFDAILTLPALGEAPLSTEGTGNSAPCVLWTLLGLPSASVPCGFGQNGLPLAVQLVGAAGRDSELLDVCVFTEKALNIPVQARPTVDL